MNQFERALAMPEDRFVTAIKALELRDWTLHVHQNHMMRQVELGLVNMHDGRTHALTVDAFEFARDPYAMQLKVLAWICDKADLAAGQALVANAMAMASKTTTKTISAANDTPPPLVTRHYEFEDDADL